MDIDKRLAIGVVGLVMLLLFAGISATIIAEGILGVPHEVVTDWLSQYISPIFAWGGAIVTGAVALLGLLFILAAALNL